MSGYWAVIIVMTIALAATVVYVSLHAEPAASGKPPMEPPDSGPEPAAPSATPSNEEAVPTEER